VPVAEVVEEIVSASLNESEGYALFPPIGLLARGRDDPIIVADEGMRPETLRLRFGHGTRAVTLDGVGTKEFVVDDIRGALPHIFVEVTIGLPSEHTPVEAHPILLGDAPECRLIDGFGDTVDIIHRVARPSYRRARDEVLSEARMLREEAVGRPHTHRPRHETKLPIGVEVKVKLIIPIVPEDEEIIALLLR